MQSEKTVIENILDYVKQQMSVVRFGRVVIELVETSDKIDVVTEIRQRFEKK